MIRLLLEHEADINAKEYGRSADQGNLERALQPADFIFKFYFSKTQNQRKITKIRIRIPTIIDTFKRIYLLGSSNTGYF
jgi:hypothetical protein